MSVRLATVIGMSVMAALTISAAACLPEVETTPTSTLPFVAPSTTHVPVEMGSREVAPSGTVQPDASFTAPMLDGETHTLRSSDPDVRFIDGEPAEIRRIAELANDADCEQLHSTLVFWLGFVDDTGGVGEGGGDGGDGGDDGSAQTDTSRRASLFGRAAYDSLVTLRCGDA